MTEPSEFGLHDLKMAVELVKLYNIPYGIIINKDDGQDKMKFNYLELFHIVWKLLDYIQMEYCYVKIVIIKITLTI